MTHPTIRHLTDHADGSLTSGMRLLVATHLTYCPSCRSKVARLEAIGGALLATEPVPEGVAQPDLAATLARLDASPRREAVGAEGERAGLPAPIRNALGPGTAALPWRRSLPGLWEIRIPADPGEDVRLLRGRPGTKILAHTHEGDEATLVVGGRLRDGDRTFAPGELSLCGPEHNHMPEVVGDEDCLCLLVLGGRMRFTGPVGRILNLFPQ